MYCAIMTFNDHVYQVKFGILSLINLTKDLYINDKIKLLKQHFCLAEVSELDGTLLTYAQKNDFFEKNIVDNISAQWLEEVLSEAETTALGEYSEMNKQTYIKLMELLVGQAEMSLQDFNSMTPAELDIVYRGYLKRKELEANCWLLALRKAKDPKATEFSLLSGEGYNYISDEDREKVLKTLDI